MRRRSSTCALALSLVLLPASLRAAAPSATPPPPALRGAATAAAAAREDGPTAGRSRTVGAANASVEEASSADHGLDRKTSQQTGGSSWCKAEAPSANSWPRSCQGGGRTHVKVLTYNLFWWNLFARRGGNGGSAGHLVAATGHQERYDLLAFQECEEVGRVLGDARLADQYTAIQGPYALAVAFRSSAWELIGNGVHDVAEDAGRPNYGRRAGQWVRLRHRAAGFTVFFLNHHGPLPLHSGGMCGGEATAFNLLKVIATEADRSDSVILAGDFNANLQALAVQSLRTKLHLAFSGEKFGGVDHIFTSCGPSSVVSTANLGSGGSDHDALSVVLQI